MNRHTSVVLPKSWFLEVVLFYWSIMRPSFDLFLETIHAAHGIVGLVVILISIGRSPAVSIRRRQN